ncbi:hypothetical protein EC844_103198 [Acinetobacter calcoaceticus]|uniref:Surface-adhesin protein E-like domain-containing protein n=1 Tax=Acinetobacter calcoaceticus TaxID=471 RepID=A0A4R1Y151_ACICA|nr:hypothetical protein EC844_103198 [Acinetobacter calcoaceticus]
MKNIFVVMISSFASFGVMAQNLELMTGDANNGYYIDKDSIEKKGQYYQASLVMKHKKIEKTESPSAGTVSYNQQINIFKFNCMDNSNYLSKVSNYLDGKLVSNDFNPNAEKLTKDDSGMTDFICDKYFPK